MINWHLSLGHYEELAKLLLGAAPQCSDKWLKTAITIEADMGIITSAESESLAMEHLGCSSICEWILQNWPDVASAELVKYAITVAPVKTVKRVLSVIRNPSEQGYSCMYGLAMHRKDLDIESRLELVDDIRNAGVLLPFDWFEMSLQQPRDEIKTWCRKGIAMSAREGVRAVDLAAVLFGPSGARWLLEAGFPAGDCLWVAASQRLISAATKRELVDLYGKLKVEIPTNLLDLAVSVGDIETAKVLHEAGLVLENPKNVLLTFINNKKPTLPFESYDASGKEWYQTISWLFCIFCDVLRDQVTDIFRDIADPSMFDSNLRYRYLMNHLRPSKSAAETTVANSAPQTPKRSQEKKRKEHPPSPADTVVTATAMVRASSVSTHAPVRPPPPLQLIPAAALQPQEESSTLKPLFSITGGHVNYYIRSPVLQLPQVNKRKRIKLDDEPIGKLLPTEFINHLGLPHASDNVDDWLNL
jgi:hypothetical protein